MATVFSFFTKATWRKSPEQFAASHRTAKGQLEWSGITGFSWVQVDQAYCQDPSPGSSKGQILNQLWVGWSRLIQDQSIQDRLKTDMRTAPDRVESLGPFEALYCTPSWAKGRTWGATFGPQALNLPRVPEPQTIVSISFEKAAGVLVLPSISVISVSQLSFNSRLFLVDVALQRWGAQQAEEVLLRTEEALPSSCRWPASTAWLLLWFSSYKALPATAFPVSVRLVQGHKS